MPVAGVDVSVRSVDVVLLDDDGAGASWHSFPCADDRGPFFAARKAAAFLPGRGSMFWDEVWLVGVEEPFSQNRGTVRALALINGALAGCLPERLTAVLLPPNEWQRIFLEVARLPARSAERKALIRERCVELGFSYSGLETQDACDAFGIAWATRALNAAAVAAGETRGAA